MTAIDHQVDEETPLLQKKQPSPTPLRWSQVSIVLLTQVCEPLASQSIYPYINQLISELDITGGDESKVGYYAGIIDVLDAYNKSLFMWNAQWEYRCNEECYG
ncbi:hypothetical protein ONZ45_g6840 [Pleurotus djamor]|nr:hypothetical protein ONZ45_g6840 [Pleurotus djamor]